MSFIQRVAVANLFALGTGFALGSGDVGRMAGLRYRAENAHRLPTSTTGWYFYHKSKNYAIAYDGIKAGVKKGGQIAGWATLFFLIEESMDIFRGTWRAGRTIDEMEGVDELDLTRMDREIENSRNFLSTTVAGMVTAGLWSVRHHFPPQTAARTMRYGLIGGLVYGLGQDGIMWWRSKVGYVENENPVWTALAEKAEAKNMEQLQPSGDQAEEENWKS
jgi:hypothetical protein